MKRKGGWDPRLVSVIRRSVSAILRSYEVKADAMAEIASVYKLLSSVHPVSLSDVRLVVGFLSLSLSLAVCYLLCVDQISQALSRSLTDHRRIDITQYVVRSLLSVTLTRESVADVVSGSCRF